MNKLLIFLALIFSILLGCEHKEDNDNSVEQRSNKIASSSKKIVFVAHKDPTTQGCIQSQIAFKKKMSKQVDSLTFLPLETGLNEDSLSLTHRADSLAAMIKKISPDIIIASGNLVQKYLISRKFKAAQFPIIFLNIDWSVDEYEYNTPNITGIIDQEPVLQLLGDLESFSSGKKLGFLSGDTYDDRKSLTHYEKKLGIQFTESSFVKNYLEWESEFLRLQNSVDILIIRNKAGVKNWNTKMAINLVKENTRIPTGSLCESMQLYAFLSYFQPNKLHGEYAAETAIKILKTNIIPKTFHFSTHISRSINMTLSENLAKKPSAEFIQDMHITRLPKTRVLFINSYHQGYEWSDKIEMSFLKSLVLEKVQPQDSIFINNNFHIKITRLNTKLNQKPKFLDLVTKNTFKIFQEWQPHIVVACDDNASKFFIRPYLYNSKTPILFCGLNNSISEYDFPTQHIRGIIETSPIISLLDFVSPYIDGKKIAYLGSNTLSEQKEVLFLKEKQNITFTEGRLVHSTQEWIESFEEMQKRNDIIILLSPAGISDWNHLEVRKWLYSNSKILSISTSTNTQSLSAIHFSRIPEEQGWWLGKRVLEIQNGKDISKIPVAESKEFQVHLTPMLLRNAKVKLPANIWSKAMISSE